MTQEFHLSVTPIRENNYLVRTERVAPGVPLAEEQVTWEIDMWLAQARQLMNDPLTGLLRGDSFSDVWGQVSSSLPDLSEQPSSNLVAFGQQLYNSLFQGTIRDSWMTAQGIAKHRNEILRLRLGLKDARLPCLPWEVLHTGDRPLATGTDVVFSRYYSGSAAMTSLSLLQQSALWEPDQFLRILMVLSAPNDQEILALKQEAFHLQEELQRATRSGVGGRQFANIELTILDQPGREQLTQALEHHHYHVLHYAGHSNLGTDGGSLYLVSSKTGLTETLSGDDLAGLLVNNGIRMVVFNSCRGVYSPASAPQLDSPGDGNLADALIKRGILAVLAMAERIPDEVALNLSRLFYRNLKQAYPVDLSLNRVRQGLISSYGSQQLYWALPILYMHPEFDGYLQPPNANGNGNGSSSLLVEEPAIATHRTATVPTVTNPGQTGSNLRKAGEPTPWDEEFPFDPDDLEFDDLEQFADQETVAHLVQQLSQPSVSNQQQEPPLLAEPSEDLLPEPAAPPKPQDYLWLPEKPYSSNSTTSSEPNLNPIPATNSTPVAANRGVNQTDVQVYSELEQLLADTGKLTEAIAACNRAIQVNPNDAEAYYNLGMALHEQGYLAEAISTYNQALQFNPQLAKAHNRLGIALQQQGNLLEAIRAYSQAIQINPGLSEAHQNLSLALHKKGITPGTGPYHTASVGQENQNTPTGQSVGIQTTPSARAGTAIATPPSPFSSFPKQTGKPAAFPKKLPLKLLLWGGAGATGVLMVFLGIWFFSGGFRLPFPNLPIAAQSPSSRSSPTDLQQISTPTLAALATEQLSQGNLADAQKTVELLLERGALTETAAVLTPHMRKHADNPIMNFLMGRLAWQSVRTGNTLYSLDDVRRFWETANRVQQNTQHHNVLGFIYYAEGNLDRARQQWSKTLQLTGERGGTVIRRLPESQTSSPEALTAYAGLALVAMKQAENQPPTKRSELLSEAINLRQKVLTDDPVNFQADALAKGWLWSEQAIADWQALLTLK